MWPYSATDMQSNYGTKTIISTGLGMKQLKRPLRSERSVFGRICNVISGDEPGEILYWFGHPILLFDFSLYQSHPGVFE